MRRTVMAIPCALLCALGMPSAASAFCGFYVGGADRSLYNDATVVVLMRDGTRTVLSMQNSYQGPPERFAMIVPVPVVLQQDNVRTLERAVFDRVDQLAAPRLVEYWERDPCAPRPVPRMMAPPSPSLRGRAARSGGGGDSLGVQIEAQFAVAEYDIVILSARDSSGLDTWLRQEGYQIPQNAEPALRPYVQSGTKFFVARVDPSRVTFQGGRALLSPLRVHYDSDEFSLPVRLGLINSAGTQDLLVHVLARNQRYEVANYPNVTIPTNLEVRSSVRDSFGPFYAALFDATRARHRGAVVTEYAWQAGSCDPCPGPTLTPSDIATLGGDVVRSTGAGGPRPPQLRGRGGFGWNAASEWTLTRLHHRYDRDGLGEDLVFRAAPPILGGRGTPNRGGRLDREVTPGGVNNFQGRYAILHRWTGPVTCANPQRGDWGGPPSGESARPRAARELATQPRGAPLRSFLRQPMPELEPPRARGGRGAPPAASDPTSGLVPPPAPVSRVTPATAAVGGCATASGGPSRGGAAGGLLLLTAGLALARRRR